MLVPSLSVNNLPCGVMNYSFAEGLFHGFLLACSWVCYEAVVAVYDSSQHCLPEGHLLARVWMYDLARGDIYKALFHSYVQANWSSNWAEDRI